jgi:hypothetical protein
MAPTKSLRSRLIGGGTIAIVAILMSTTAQVAATSRASFRWLHAPDGAVNARPAVDEGAFEQRIDPSRIWKVITVLEVFGPDFTFVDVGEKGDSPGDYGVFRDALTSANGKKHVGVIHVQCIEAYASHCRGSARLGGRGQITFDGITPTPVDPDRFAITGGTGEFVDVGGVFKVEFPSFEYALLTFTLTR